MNVIFLDFDGCLFTLSDYYEEEKTGISSFEKVEKRVAIWLIYVENMIVKL